MTSKNVNLQFIWSKLIRHRALIALAVLYLLVGVGYTLATPMFEKPDEPGHYGHVLYLRERHAEPVGPEAKRPSDLFPQADLPSTQSNLAFEMHQPPLYYAVAAALTAWLPDDPDPDSFFIRNPYIRSAAYNNRNDNRNYFLHPPDMTAIVGGARLVSLMFGLGTLLASYWLAGQLVPRSTRVPIATAAMVGFQPVFLFTATAISNDAAITFLGTLTVALVIYRSRKGSGFSIAAALGVTLGLAGITKESGLLFFPLVGLALVVVHRGFRLALFREGCVIIVVALMVGSWWYVRNALLRGDPLMMGAHPTRISDVETLWQWMKHNLQSIEYTFWANQTITFLNPIAFDQALIWWGRISAGVLIWSLAVSRPLRSRRLDLVVLLSWPVTFLVVVAVYWSPKTLSPYGRFLFPAMAPTFLAVATGWHYAFPARWNRLGPLAVTLSAGMFIIIGTLIPFVSLYPPFHPSHEWQEEAARRRVDITYVNEATGEPVVRLISYKLFKSSASPATFFPVELCWEPLSRTQEPMTVFVQLLDLSQLGVSDAPGTWGRRETYPGLGTRPTDRWTLRQPFCDSVGILVFPETPTPMKTTIEIGLSNAEKSNRLQAVDTEGEPITLALIGDVPILSASDQPISKQSARYTLDGAIALRDAQFSGTIGNSLTLTLTWQSWQTVSYDATTFVHLSDTNGNILAQEDHMPLGGRFPTSSWQPGQLITDVVRLPLTTSISRGPLTLNIGMYVWPSLQRLAVLDAEGNPQRDDMIALDIALSSLK